MQSAALIKQILDINKKAFENSFSVMVAFQEQSEKMVTDFFGKGSYFPAEGRKAIGDWVNQYKTGLAEYRENIDKRFKLVEDYLLNAVEQMESTFTPGVEKKVSANQGNQIKKKAVAAKDKTTAVKKAVAVKKGTAKKK